MSTGTFLVQRALQRIGAHSVVSPASPEALDEGFIYLTSLLELWESQNIILGTTPIDAIGSEINEPLDARSAIINNLALELAPSFDNGKNVVSPSLINAARRDFIKIKALYQGVTVSKKKFSSTLPLGQGNQFFSFLGGESIDGGSGSGGGTGGVLPIASGGTDASTAAGARTSLGLEIGTDVQAFDAILDDLSGLTQAINTVPYFDTATTAALLNFLDEDNMASDDPLGLASQQSIKAFVEAQVTLADLDFSGDSGTGAVDLDTQVFSVVSGGGITTLAASQSLTISLDASNTVQTTITNLVTVGALNSGSIASGFGPIDIGSSAITTTGLISGGTATITGTITGPSGTWDTGGLDIAASDSYAVNGTAILSDAAGVMTLSNVDALDATTESTIEAAIDALANLVSIQSLTVTLADAGANAFLGWDDAASAYENLTSAEATAILDAATTTLQGAVEFGTTAEYRSNSSNIRALEGNQVWDAMAEVALTSTSNSVAWDMSLGLDFDIDTLGENTTIANPTNTTVGKKGRLRIVQDGTGTRTVAWGTSYEFSGGSAPTASTTAADEDVFYYDVISSTRIVIAAILDIS